MWRSWEAARIDPTGMSAWWTSVADPNMAQLLSANGPFSVSEDQNRKGQPLPYTAPPAGMFSTDHQTDHDFPPEP
jgi:hypothetical protein